MTVPFSFILDGKLMPAGRYDVGAIGVGDDRLVVEGAHFHAPTDVVPVVDRLPDPAKAKPALVFDWIEGQYHLVKAELPGMPVLRTEEIGASRVGAIERPAQGTREGR